MSRLGAHRQAEAALQDIARTIGGALPEGIVFTLITYTVGEGGYSAYVSNGHRDDMIKALKETVARLEAKTTSGPFADVEELLSKKNRHQRRAEGKR